MIRISYDKKLDAAVFILEGEISFDEAKNTVLKYYNGPLTKYTLTDISRADPSTHLTTSEIKQIGELVSRLGKARPGGVDIMVIPGIIPFSIARIYQAYADVISSDPDRLTSKIFRTMKEALAFIEADRKKRP